MAQPGKGGKVHPGKRHNNPDTYKNGKPRIRGYNLARLIALLEKTATKKEKRKIQNQIDRKTK
jgi:hypothetical protein